MLGPLLLKNAGIPSFGLSWAMEPIIITYPYLSNLLGCWVCVDRATVHREMRAEPQELMAQWKEHG